MYTKSPDTRLERRNNLARATQISPTAEKRTSLYREYSIPSLYSSVLQMSINSTGESENSDASQRLLSRIGDFAPSPRNKNFCFEQRFAHIRGSQFEKEAHSTSRYDSLITAPRLPKQAMRQEKVRRDMQNRTLARSARTYAVFYLPLHLTNERQLRQAITHGHKDRLHARHLQGC